MHAWRALGQLGAEEAIEPLITFFDEEEIDNEWIGGDLPDVFSVIGAAAIPALKTYLNNRHNDMFKRIIVSACLKLIAESYPNNRYKCIDILTEQLELFKSQKRTLNGALVRQLMELKAIDSMMVIEKAFATRKVDIQYSCADLFDLRAYFGLKQTAAIDELNL